MNELEHRNPEFKGLSHRNDCGFNMNRDGGGLSIKTCDESHRGEFPGTHARYVHLSAEEIVSRSDEERAAV